MAALMDESWRLISHLCWEVAALKFINKYERVSFWMNLKN